MTRAKKRFMAYVFATLFCVFTAMYFFIGQKDYSANNWYFTEKENAQLDYLIFEPDTPYTVKADCDLHFISIKNYAKQDTPLYFIFRENPLREYGSHSGIVMPIPFNITVKKKTYIAFSFYITGWFFPNCNYEIHKNIKEGNSYIYTGRDSSLHYSKN